MNSSGNPPVAAQLSAITARSVRTAARTPRLSRVDWLYWGRLSRWLQHSTAVHCLVSLHIGHFMPMTPNKRFDWMVGDHPDLSQVWLHYSQVTHSRPATPAVQWQCPLGGRIFWVGISYQKLSFEGFWRKLIIYTKKYRKCIISLKPFNRQFMKKFPSFLGFFVIFENISEFLDHFFYFVS